MPEGPEDTVLPGGAVTQRDLFLSGPGFGHCLAAPFGCRDRRGPGCLGVGACLR